MRLNPLFLVTDPIKHGVDTAKYYRQAERELAAEQAEKAGST